MISPSVKLSHWLPFNWIVKYSPDLFFFGVGINNLISLLSALEYLAVLTPLLLALKNSFNNFALSDVYWHSLCSGE